MTRGYIVPIGGAEEKVRDPEILRRFVDLCGGDGARIAVIPTASELPETGQRYLQVFRSLGVRRTRVLPFEGRSDGSRRRWLDWLERADGVFLTGGNQLRLSTALGGTPAAETLRRRNLEGWELAPGPRTVSG